MEKYEMTKIGDYIELQYLIKSLEHFFYARDTDYEYNLWVVVDCMLYDLEDNDLPFIIDGLSRDFAARMHAVSPAIIQLVILKRIFVHGGRYIHQALKNFIIDSKKNPLHDEHACKISREESLKKVISAFLKEFSLPIAKEELVLDQNKEPINWWKDTLKSYMEEVI